MIPWQRFGASALLMTLMAGPGLAQGSDPELLGAFADWSAYAYKAADSKVCYISARPKASDPANAKRDPAFFLVTNMPGRKVRGEISTIIGYPFKKDSIARLAIDEAAFELFTNADGAWAESAAAEKKIVAAMRNGQSLIVTGTSWRGTQTVDTYSLNGVSAALAKIDDACK